MGHRSRAIVAPFQTRPRFPTPPPPAHRKCGSKPLDRPIRFVMTRHPRWGAYIRYPNIPAPIDVSLMDSPHLPSGKGFRLPSATHPQDATASVSIHFILMSTISVALGPSERMRRLEQRHRALMKSRAFLNPYLMEKSVNGGPCTGSGTPVLTRRRSHKRKQRSPAD